MDKKLQDKIFNDYPELFKHMDNMHASLMCFGMECRNGWYDLIYNLCKDIHSYYTKHGGIPESFYVTQIKEKWGSLRYYTTGAPMMVHRMIDKAEHKSFYICEVCGKEGKEFHRDMLPWIQTLCDSCLDKQLLEHYNKVRKRHEDYISKWQKKNKAPFKMIEVKEKK